MDERMVRFVAGLRGAGVRVSLAESQDAFAAARAVGVLDRQRFRSALKATLVKEHNDQEVFDELFPLYFGTGTPPTSPAGKGLSQLSQDQLEQALQAMADELRELLQRALEGEHFDQEELQSASQQAGRFQPGHRYDQRRHSRHMKRRLGLTQLLQEIRALLQALAEVGMDPEDLESLAEQLGINYNALNEQVEHFAGLQMAERRADERPHEPYSPRIMDQPFHSLSAREAEALRQEVTRLAARLRTRLALRQKRGKGRRLDAKATLRASLRTGSVPFELIRRVRRRKARFTLICDVSTSMRPVVSFLLLLMYQIHAQVGRTRSFAFIDHIEEISTDISRGRPEEAVPEVLRRIPPGHYNTDLGRSLQQFVDDFPGAVDRKTTVVVCGDGRNNYNDPRTDLIEWLSRRAHQVVWFNPEPPSKWGFGDSDMPTYAPLADAVFQVSNLRQLSRAVDEILV